MKNSILRKSLAISTACLFAGACALTGCSTASSSSTVEESTTAEEGTVQGTVVSVSSDKITIKKTSDSEEASYTITSSTKIYSLSGGSQMPSGDMQNGTVPEMPGDMQVPDAESNAESGTDSFVIVDGNSSDPGAQGAQNGDASAMPGGQQGGDMQMPSGDAAQGGGSINPGTQGGGSTDPGAQGGGSTDPGAQGAQGGQAGNQNGSAPEMPSGDAQNGSAPEMPSGDAQNGSAPEMPSGDAQNGSVPEMPGDMQMPDITTDLNLSAITQMGSEITTDSINVGDNVYISIASDGSAELIIEFGQMGGNMGGGGGQSAANIDYTAAVTYASDTTQSGETVNSTGTDENAILVSDSARVII